MRKLHYAAIGVLLGMAVVATVFLVRQIGPGRDPEGVAREYFVETYTRDFAAAWELASSADQAARPKDDYLAANPPAPAEQAALFERLASWGEFQVISLASGQPGAMTVTASVRFPNSAQPELLELFAQAESDPDLSEQLLDRLMELHEREALQFFEGEVSVNLILEDDGWRVLQHWGTAVTVRLAAWVSPNLPWEFYPVEHQLQAVPGQLVKASYIARNLSDHSITAKAIHEVGPAAVAGYFQTVQCFCFTEQTLEPGEQREMTLLFLIDPQVPPGAAVIQNRYSFYSLDEFPADS